MKKIAALLILVFASQLFAHEFWLQPDRFQYQTGDTATVHFFVGEGFAGEYWGRELSKINSLKHYTAKAEEDINSTVTGNKVDSLKLVLKTEGTHLITFNSNNSFIELEAEKFNDYLAEDGLYNTALHRKRNNETNKPGKEYYQRSVKVLLQCGAKKDDTYKKETNLPLDIIPQTNPSDIKRQKRVAFKVLFNHAPLKGALVKIWHKLPGRKKVLPQLLHTDFNGEVTTTVSSKGTWLISCVNMVPNTKDTVAQWQSYWGSICFGY